MKKNVLTSLLWMCLPVCMVAQNVNDDLYFIPKKQAEKKVEVTQASHPATSVNRNSDTYVYNGKGTTLVVNDKKGYTRDVDEYNRRYSARDNQFTVQDDTLYIEEKPMNERGEWVNGFEGSQSDYEYAMRLVRFRNPRFAVSISSPLYWDMIYMLPSWEWNVYVDDFYAYAFPTYSNSLWWDWRFNYPYGWGWGWHSPWYYSSWYSPWYYSSWYGPGYWGWGSYWGGYWGHPWHHHYYGGWYGPGYWGGHYAWHGSSRRYPGVHSDRYVNNYAHNYRSGVSTRSNYGRGGTYTRGNGSSSNYNTNRSASSYRTRTGSAASTRSGSAYNGRVISGNSNDASVRPSTRTRTGGAVSGSSSGINTRSAGNTYNRPSSTRSSVSGSASGAAQRGAYRSSGSSSYSRSNSGAVTRSNSSTRSYSPSTSRSSGSYSRSSGGSSYGSGGGSRSSGSFGGGGGGRSGGFSGGGGGGRHR